MNYQTKTTKVQAMQLESNVCIGAGFATPTKGEWLVVEDGKLKVYDDTSFKNKFELVLPKPTYTKLDELLGIGTPRWPTSGHKMFD